MPPPVTTESTSATAAHASAGSTAKRHGLLLAQRMARLGRARHRAPTAATTKKATAPMATEPLRALRPCPAPMRCRPRSPTATTPPVTAAAPHGAADMAALETVISSRLERSWSVGVDADIRIPALRALAQHSRVQHSRAQHSRHIVSWWQSITTLRISRPTPPGLPAATPGVAREPCSPGELSVLPSSTGLIYPRAGNLLARVDSGQKGSGMHEDDSADGGSLTPPAGPSDQPGRARALLIYLVVAVLSATAGVGTTLAVQHATSTGPRGTGMPRDAAADRPGALNDEAVYNKVEPGVVDVTANLQYLQETAKGTGFVIDAAAGLVLTNNHVIDAATSVTVTLVTSGKSYPARILGYDPAHAVALLQLRGATGLKAVAIGNSSALRA